MKQALFSVLLVLSFAAHAGEAQLACNLERSKAEVAASTLIAPSAFASVGDTTTSEKNVSIGVSQSWSGRTQAAMIREAAEAKCASIAASVQLDTQALWAVAQVKRDGSQAELKIIDEAILMAVANLEILEKQVAVKSATVVQATNARQTLVTLETQRAELQRLLAIEVLPAPRMNVKAMIEQVQRQEAKSAALTAKASAESGWDVVTAAGVRQAISGGGATPFVAITAKYSFGLDASRSAAQDVGRNTQLLLASQQAGYSQTTDRQRLEFERLVGVEQSAIALDRQQLDQIQPIWNSVKTIDTELAKDTSRTLELQLHTILADLTGSEVRLKGYIVLLEALQ